MRSTYRALAYLIAAGVALQAASVALGFFTIIHEVDGGGIISADYDYDSNLGIMLHRIGGLGIIPLLAIALLIVLLHQGTRCCALGGRRVRPRCPADRARLRRVRCGVSRRVAWAERARGVRRCDLGRTADLAGV